MRFARAFFEQHKPVGAICHAAWSLIEAEVVAGRTLTSYPSLKTDLRNAGANRSVRRLRWNVGARAGLVQEGTGP